MPIVDVHVVAAAQAEASISAQELADALGDLFGSEPGRTWVRVHLLDARRYAENRAPPLAAGQWPVFVMVLKAHPPEEAALAAEVAAVTRAVAGVLGRAPDRVHVEYAAAAAGRQAFGGRLIR